MSSPPVLRQYRLRVPAAAEEPVAALLETVFGEPAAVYSDAETGQAELSLYRPPQWSPSGTERSRLREGLERLRDEGLLPRLPRLSRRTLRGEDWAESWKRHFKARVFGGRVLVRPSWSRRRPRQGEVQVVLDPGLSFGTGQHATTAFCLEQIAASAPAAGATGRRRGDRRSLLDVGTGSGILAIAAVKLGYAPVRAVDFDQAAVRVARENAVLNEVEGALRPVRGDVRRLSLTPRRRYDVVAANLLTPLLLETRERLNAQLAPSGRLILAGILAREFRQIERAWREAGFRLVASATEREWRSGAFEPTPR